LAVIFASLISPGLSASETGYSSLGEVKVPSPSTPLNVQQCVEPTEVMRRNHMEFLLHKRDETVLDGIRSKKYSLTGCINCHAQATDGGEVVRAENPKYFCTSCHEYAAVEIDCFECHSDRPDATEDQLGFDTWDQHLLTRIDTARLDDSPRSRLRYKLLHQVDIRGN